MQRIDPEMYELLCAHFYEQPEIKLASPGKFVVNPDGEHAKELYRRWLLEKEKSPAEKIKERRARKSRVFMELYGSKEKKDE